MDKGFEQLGKMKGLLAQALGVANHSMEYNRSVNEAKSHIRQAIRSVDKATKSQIRKKQITESQFQTWWGNIQAGTAHAAMAPMPQEANAKSLDALNKMIETEENKLKDLEDSQNQAQKQAPDQAQNQAPDQLLSD